MTVLDLVKPTITLHDLEKKLELLPPGIPTCVTCDDMAALGLEDPPFTVDGDPDAALPADLFAARFGCQCSGPYWGGGEVDDYYLFVRPKAKLS